MWGASRLVKSRFGGPRCPKRHACGQRRDSDTSSNEKPVQRASGEEPAARSGWVRTVAFWASTVVVLAELIAGSVWNLAAIEWVEIQMSHLGYPHSFVYVLGVCHVGAAAAIIAPGFRLLKEWAYAGTVLMWSGAVVSHLATGDGVESWGPPLMFASLATMSWALRPADRRRLRLAASGRSWLWTGLVEPGPRAWFVPIVLVTVLYAVSS